MQSRMHPTLSLSSAIHFDCIGWFREDGQKLIRVRSQVTALPKVRTEEKAL